MSAVAIRVEGLSKQYKIGGPAEPYGSLRESLARAVTNPFRRLRRPTAAAEDTTLWVLRDVSFEVKHGEVVGIIGRNGAGKSTLLKVLSRITEPTKGRIDLYGRVGSLLEVGTGFHPELTGRENIMLNGTILGMSRNDIRARFDEIVAFAEVDRFIDTPVKRYSSGMYTRLAFSVAAHLEPEILLVDEVLAVGDAAFQKKCVAKMGSVAQDGRAIIFVSHNMQIVRALCSRTIVLDGGRVIEDASTNTAMRAYSHLVRTPNNIADVNLKNRLNRTSGAVRFISVAAVDEGGTETWDFSTGDTVRLRLRYQVFDKVSDLGLYVALEGGNASEVITTIKEVISDQPQTPGTQGTVTVELPDISIRPGEYPLYVCLGDRNCERLFDVVDKNINLPWLSIHSAELDPHRTAGYFSVPSRLVVNVG